MIQINLLPDVKREYLKAQQTKHAVVMVAILLSIVTVTLAALLFVYVRVLQPSHRTNIQKDIDSGIAKLKASEDAVEIVTVQGALEQIGALQDKKVVTSRVFNYVTSFTPRGVSYGAIKLDTATGIMTIAGVTSTHEKANELANNIKNASFTHEVNKQQQKLTPFSAVVFNSLSSNENSDSGKQVVFELTFKVEMQIFNQATQNGKIVINKSDGKLVLPNTQPFNETEIPQS